MRNNNKGFYKIREDRKYASFVDEYRRYYVTGKNLRVRLAKGKNLGNEIFRIAVEEILRPIRKAKISDKKIGYEDLHRNLKLGNSKFKKNIVVAEYIENRKFIMQYTDESKNIYRIIIESPSNKSSKIKYSEWIKKDKTFFGLNDTMGKIFMRRSMSRKVKVLRRKINNVLFNKEEKEFSFEKETKRRSVERDYENSNNLQQTKGFIRRKKVTYKDDMAGRYVKPDIAPDKLKKEDEKLNNSLKEFELNAENQFKEEEK